MDLDMVKRLFLSNMEKIQLQCCSFSFLRIFDLDLLVVSSLSLHKIPVSPAVVPTETQSTHLK